LDFGLGGRLVRPAVKSGSEENRKQKASTDFTDGTDFMNNKTDIPADKIGFVTIRVNSWQKKLNEMKIRG
jgi:hypothetical protein